MRTPGPKALVNGEAFAALGAAPLEHDAPILGAHPDEKAVSAATAAAVWLERAFHFGNSRPGDCALENLAS